MPNHQDNSPADVANRLRRLAGDRVASRRSGRDASGAVGDPGSVAELAERAVLTTVDATIRPVGTRRPGRFRYLDWAEGEPHLIHPDSDVVAADDRQRRRRSLLYVAQHTDTHLCDSQAPARLEAGETFGWVNPGTDGGHRPQETLTTQVLDRMVAATNAVAESPITGASMAWCVQTGDNTDNRTAAELRWWLSVLEGRLVEPNTGAPGRYEGIQRSGWRGVWHPDDPRRRDLYRRAGFPYLPGLLDAAVAPFPAEGLKVPWLAVFGNHDSIFTGTFGPSRSNRLDLLEPMLAASAAKPTGTVGLIRAIVHATVLGADPRRWERWADRIPVGIRQVTADPEGRAAVSRHEYVAALFDEDTEHGPIGHGFTSENLSAGTSWWSRPEGDLVQVIGLDTCNHTNGDGGGIGPAQMAWLEDELQRHHRRWMTADGQWATGAGPDRLIVLVSHHNSWTMDNTHNDDADPGSRIGGREFVRFLHRFPNVVLWINGHSHEHRVIRHRVGGNSRAASDRVDSRDGIGDGRDGFWEVDTASLIDFSQQGRTFELLDNSDGTISILTTVIDHASPPRAPRHQRGSWNPTELASLSRELAVNDDRWIDPVGLLGSPLDRNVELLLRAPFQLDH